VVYNGIALDGYPPAPTPPETPTVGYLARMCAPKGLAALVEAFLLLGKRMPAARLKIGGAQTAGDVAYVASLQTKIAAAGLSERVSFHPNLTRDEKIAFLQSLSTLSVPATYGESFGLYVIEALAAGVPVVQPRHAVFPELLSATGGGVLYEPDNPQALAEALEGVLSDPTRAATLGAAGQKNVRERFSVEVMAHAVAAVLQEGDSSHDPLRVV
jgi:glycosyltransferase involved in cell wall biosynthesis